MMFQEVINYKIVHIYTVLNALFPKEITDLIGTFIGDEFYEDYFEPIEDWSKKFWYLTDYFYNEDIKSLQMQFGRSSLRKFVKFNKMEFAFAGYGELTFPNIFLRTSKYEEDKIEQLYGIPDYCIDVREDVNTECNDDDEYYDYEYDNDDDDTHYFNDKRCARH